MTGTLGRAEMTRCVDLFATAMRQELRRNTHKDGWEEISAEVMAESLLYHAAKLVVAVTLNNPEAIREYAADVGNEAMMVADCSGVLGLPQAPQAVLIGDVVFDVTDPKPEAGQSDGGKTSETLGELAKEFFRRVQLVAQQDESEWAALTSGKVGPFG